MKQNEIRRKINVCLRQIERGKELYFRAGSDKVKRGSAKLVMSNHRELMELRKQL